MHFMSRGHPMKAGFTKKKRKKSDFVLHCSYFKQIKSLETLTSRDYSMHLTVAYFGFKASQDISFKINILECTLHKTICCLSLEHQIELFTMRLFQRHAGKVCL